MKIKGKFHWYHSLATVSRVTRFSESKALHSKFSSAFVFSFLTLSLLVQYFHNVFPRENIANKSYLCRILSKSVQSAATYLGTQFNTSPNKVSSKTFCPLYYGLWFHYWQFGVRRNIHKGTILLLRSKRFDLTFAVFLRSLFITNFC